MNLGAPRAVFARGIFDFAFAGNLNHVNLHQTKLPFSAERGIQGHFKLEVSEMPESKKCPKCPNSPEMEKADFKVFLQAAEGEKHGMLAKVSRPNAGTVLELFRCPNCRLVLLRTVKKSDYSAHHKPKFRNTTYQHL